LTTPENEMWVNLSPYEKDRIVPERFGQTEMGRDLLAQDYILKQITASLIYPEDELGKKFWDRVYAEAKKKFGTTDIPVNTFNKVWIVPAKAVVYENPQSASAYVVESSLNVMLEEDYLALQKSEAAKIDDKQTSVIGNQIIREVVIPALTKEVNEGKNFAQLRQIYNSLILAAWYKKKIKDSIISQVYVDQNKVAGVNIDNPNEKQIIYEQYLEAFKKGAYNYIKEEVDSATQEVIPKKYFSGGFAAQQLKLDIRRDDESLLSSTPVVDAEILQMQLVASSPADDSAELLASAEDRFEKPYSKLVQKPERQLNENVAEKNSAIEIQMEIDRLIPDLDQIIFAHESQGLQATEDLRDRQSEFLQGLRSLAIDIRVSVNDELEFIGLSKILKDLRASRNRIYYAIEKADRQKDVEALKALNQQAIRNNRLVLKAQLLLAAKMFENRVTLKNPAFIYSAVRETLRGALNSAQMLEEELGYRIGRLQAAKMVREIETSDWLGNIVRTFRMSGFDIKVAPATPEDREPAITVRQQHYINVHTRLDQTLTDIRQGRVAAAQTQLDLLRDIYHVETANVYERYSEIDAGLKAIRAKTNGLVEGQILRRSSAEAQAFAADIEELKSLVEVPKMRVWMDVNFEEGLDSAFRGYIHRFAGYIQEIGTITRNKTTLEFFASKLRAAEKAQSLSQRNLTILVNGMAPIVQWAQRGFVFEKQRVVINLEPVVEKIKSGDYEGAQGDISLAVTKLQSRLEEIERIVGHSKRQAASVFSAFRDKDISRRAGEISGLLQKSEFAAGFRELEMLIELYFNQDQVEPGYIRAALSLHKAAGKIRAMQRSPNPKYLLSQTLSLLRLAQKDVRHKYSLKVDLIDPNGTKTPAIYINPGTTVLGLLNSRGINPASVQVSIGAGWISRGDLGRTQIPDGKTVVLKAAVSSSAILANAPLSPEAKLRVGRHVDEVMTLLTVNRDEPGYQAAFYKDSNQDDSESLPQQFRRDVQNITDDTEIRFFALALDEVWKTNGYEKDLGSVFEYAADIFSDYKSTPSQIKKGFAWFYKFLEAAPLLERTKALRLLVLAFNNHLRSGGFHAEDETTRIGLSADSFPLDAELLLGNDRDLPGPQIFQRYILSLLELQQSPAWTEVIPKNKKPNRLGLTYEDMFLWALVLAVDPTVYGEGYAQYPVDLLEGYLSKYFGEDVEVENSGIKFVEKAFNHESLRDKKPQIQALLQKALNITAAQWEDKGQRDPYSFALKLDYLWPILSAPSFWSDKSLFVLGDPMLMLGLSLSYLPRRMREEFTMLPRVEDRNKILWEQLPGGLRPLYVKAFGSAQLAAIFPGLRIATVASSSTMESDAGVGQRAGEFFQRIVDEKTTTDPATFWSFLLKEMNSYVTEKNLQAIWLADSLPAGVEWKSEVALFAQKMRDLWNTPTDGQGASLNAIYGSLFPLMTLSINYDYSSNLLRLRLEHQWLYEFLSIAAPREQAKSLWLIMVSNVIHMRNGGMHREEDEFDQPVSHDVEILYGRTGYAGAISKFVENIKLLSTQAGFEDAVEDVRDPWTGKLGR
jgi:hypothetical protein